jgi:hypothetical protein
VYIQKEVELPASGLPYSSLAVTFPFSLINLTLYKKIKRSNLSSLILNPF